MSYPFGLRFADDLHALRSSLQELNGIPTNVSEIVQMACIEIEYGGQVFRATAKLCPSRKPDIQARYRRYELVINII